MNKVQQAITFGTACDGLNLRLLHNQNRDPKEIMWLQSLESLAMSVPRIGTSTLH